MIRPSGTVTFLFTDVEGSTRRWESDPEAMRSALAAHDEVLRSAVEANGGWLFKHTGDGVCAAFSAAADAVAAAVEAQRRLGLPVRMGIGTGNAELRGEDYFGPALNRTARVMAVGHGGQILVAPSTAALLDGIDLVDLGEHHLRDLSGAHRLFQVRADGLAESFEPLRTLDAVPGNLPLQLTSFVGREVEVKELIEVVRAHRLATLTGVGGVGKTRLAVQVAAELTGEFPDGVWLVELAPVGDPAAVADVAATALGITAQAGLSITDSIVRTLSGRHVLLVVDNCEHVLDAAADLIDAVLARTSTVQVIATSREGLRVGAEQLWSVPSLDLHGGTRSAAVELFGERARGVVADFELAEPAEAAAVEEICRRLDGIPLAIELAAARMVSMNPEDVRDRLGDRFRLLAGARRGLERHQTLRHVVGWSYDLLDDEERAVLNRCSVFADGFDLRAATHVNDGLDDYQVLDGLDSLVRKSLVTVDRSGHHARYGMLETIRQFAEDQLAATGSIDEVRDGHARYFAAQAIAHCELWDGPRQRESLDWVDAELANLRTGFRWATDRSDLETAAAIAAHTTMIALALQRLESIGWTEEILPAAASVPLPQLPRLYMAASTCMFTGRPEDGVRYARAAVALEADPGFDPFPYSRSRFYEASSHAWAGRLDEALTISADMAAQNGPAHVYGCCLQTQMLAMLGRSEEAIALSEETVFAARAHGNPFLIGHALYTFGRAHAPNAPRLALDAFREGLVYARDHRLPFWEASMARDAARVETIHGDVDSALTLFDAAIESFQQGGFASNVNSALASLVVCFERLQRPESAATIYGTTHEPHNVTELAGALDHLRTVLGGDRFETCVAAGTAMEHADAVRYARDQIGLARDERAADGPTGGGPPS